MPAVVRETALHREGAKPAADGASFENAHAKGGIVPIGGFSLSG